MSKLRNNIHLTLRRLSHGVTFGVRVAVFNTAGDILLVRHGYTPGWHMPGGGVDKGETVA
jgi:ADP-ribose pyrophosphatase YjhB (NUDIX family)